MVRRAPDTEEQITVVREILASWDSSGAWIRESTALHAILGRLEKLEQSHSKMIGLAKNIWHAGDDHASQEVRDVAREIIDGAREVLV
jgi:hypothetical protein